ncbi:MAG: LPS assembly protein LptD [Candidatus Omnitrophota bacterium]|nr:LPS assembly protein LptD [Candidatus Omnitrophota bacterium]
MTLLRRMTFSISWVLILLAVCLPGAVAAESKIDPKRALPIIDPHPERIPQVETVADSLEYSNDQKKVIAKGNVVITHGEDKITADYAEVDTATKDSYAKGHVIIFRNDEARAKGDEAYYNFDTGAGSFPQGSIISDPWYCTGEQIKQVKKGVSVIEKGNISTCRGDNPPYEIRAKKLTFYRGDKIIAQNVTILALGKPIFWWPYLIIPDRIRSLPFHITAGYNSRHGAYIETSKGIAITEQVSGKVLFDWRSKRGFAVGGNLDYDFGDYAKGEIGTYWTQDERAPTPSEGNAFSKTEDRDRGRILWRHRSDFDEYSHLLLRYNRLADEFFLQDFFEKEHRADVEPQSFVTLTKNSPWYGFMVHNSKRMNRFESMVERLPEVRFNWKNQPFLKNGLYYENETSFASMTKTFGRTSFDEDVTRVDHFGEWTRPVNYKGIKWTPFTNVRTTYYSREKESENDHFRVAYGYGADLRTHYYKTWNTTFDRLGIEINQLRHMVEPSIRYEAVRSSVSNEKLDQFDSTDAVDDSERLRFGFENRIQTKRIINGVMKRVDVVSLNTFLNYDIHPDATDNGTSFRGLTQEVVIRPYQWLQYEMRLEYDVNDSEFEVFNQDIRLSTEKFHVLFGHRYINDIDESDGSNQFVFDGKWLINKLWEVGGYVRWDGKDQELEEWQLSAVRNMDCLIFEFGYNVRSSSIRSSNKELYFNLQLTAFPDYSLRGGGSRASFSEPRIGETVAGASQSQGGFESFYTRNLARGA